MVFDFTHLHTMTAIDQLFQMRIPADELWLNCPREGMGWKNWWWGVLEPDKDIIHHYLFLFILSFKNYLDK